MTSCNRGPGSRELRSGKIPESTPFARIRHREDSRPIILTSRTAPIRPVQSKALRGRPILALPGLLASAFAIVIGCLALLTSVPSLGRQAEYGYLLSPAAGGFLFILLGLAGSSGVGLYLEKRKAAQGLLIFAGILALPGLVVLAAFREWAACFLLIMIAAVTLSGAITKKSAVLMLFAGFAGFPIGQLAIITLPYGWKTWAIPGVLFVFCGLILAFQGELNRLPCLNNKSG